MATNKQVAKAFINRQSATSKNFRTDGTTLWSYTSVVLRWESYSELTMYDNNIYSQTTKRQVNPVLSEIKEMNKFREFKIKINKKI